MVEEKQIRDAAFACNLHGLQPARMPPAFARGGELLRRILRVVDEYVRIARQTPQIDIVLAAVRFVIRGIDNGARAGLEPVAQASLRMIEALGDYAHAAYLPGLAACYVAVGALG